MWRTTLALILLTSAAFGQSVFTATIDRSIVQVGETFQLTLSVHGSMSGVRTPAAPSVEKLKVVGGPYTSSNMSITNGRAESTTSFTYVLKAMEPGKGVIGSAKIDFKGKQYSSAPITMTINPAAQGSGGKTGGRSGNDVFIRVTSDKTEAYQGEQVTLTYKLYFAAQITSPEMTKIPHTTGFWVEEFPMPNQLELTSEVINGRSYSCAIFRKLALFGTNPGDQEIESLKLKTNVEVRASRQSRDPFDIFNDPFFQLGRQMQPIEVESPTVALRIKPLPESAPTNFSGAVGDYNIKASLDKPSCAAHEAVTLTIRIEGVGNIKTLPQPSIEFPPDFEHYDPKTTEDIRRDKSRISGAKTFEYVLIPRAAGVQRIPAISYSFFDPEKVRYATIETNGFDLNVTKGDENYKGSGGIMVAGKQGVKSVGTDIAYAKTRSGSFVSIGSMPHEEFSFWVLSALPWTAFAGLALFAQRQTRLRTGTGRYRHRRAMIAATKDIKLAEKDMSGGEIQKACSRVASALEHAVAAQFDMEAGTLTTGQLEEMWQTNGFNRDLLTRIETVQRDCDLSRFGTHMVNKENAKAIIEETRRILAEIERHGIEREKA